MQKPFKIAGLGETLWDIHGEQKTFGGAPANFACHSTELGAQSFIISSVGNDTLGSASQHFLSEHGVDLAGLTVHDQLETGIVQVTLDTAGKPEYDIKENVAWDHIPYTDEMKNIAQQLHAVCFGSLAQRTDDSRQTIAQFLADTPPACLRMFDINLRLHYYSDDIIHSSLALANALKVNDEELPLLAEMFQLQGSEKHQLMALVDRFNLKLAILTCGSQGAWLVTRDDSNFTPSQDVDHIVSTVGAGDSFTATAIMGYLRQDSLAEINQHANAVASYICTQPGAVSPLPPELNHSPSPLSQ